MEIDLTRPIRDTAFRELDRLDEVPSGSSRQDLEDDAWLDEMAEGPTKPTLKHERAMAPAPAPAPRLPAYVRHS